MNTPTLINLPPPPSTPSDFGPGTPNSFTSTVALKDGVQGAVPPHNHHGHHASSASTSSTNTLDAERADRISRLAGLERVATLRGASQHLPQGSQQNPTQHPGYFDNIGNIHKSTVGSASASGSAGGRMTWASESDANETDKMSEDGISSAGLSDEGNASLVGFGETASNVSGPTSNNATRATSGMNNAARQHLMHAGSAGSVGSPMEGVEDQTRGASEGGHEQAQRIVGAALDEGESHVQHPLGHPDKGKGLGKFYFEGK